MDADEHAQDGDLVDVVALRRALAALRLNRLYPPWRAVDAHLAALAVPAPGGPLRRAPGTAWPAGADWLRVRVDHELAPGLLPSLRAAAADPAVAARVRYLEALAAARPLVETPPAVSLVGQEGEALRGELCLDLYALARPRLLRATLRFVLRPGHGLVPGPAPAPEALGFARHGLALVPSAALVARLRETLARPAAVAWAELGAWLEPELLTVGELGPARPGLGGPWLSAVLSRVGPALARTSVDDPLLPESGLPVPAPDSPVRLSHHRKWAVPAAERAAARAWLARQGSRNLVVAVR